uniref:Uncharacterized protein n=1 Tax=Leucocryptos marina TaxID=299206 RepID=A0A679EMY0_LEUMA|nr:hypothetical protein [Leucocryptos marina]BBQ05378.1 hypothetical protein [Leucocryptos marina]
MYYLREVTEQKKSAFMYQIFKKHILDNNLDSKRLITHFIFIKIPLSNVLDLIPIALKLTGSIRALTNLLKTRKYNRKLFIKEFFFPDFFLERLCWFDINVLSFRFNLVDKFSDSKMIEQDRFILLYLKVSSKKNYSRKEIKFLIESICYDFVLRRRENFCIKFFRTLNELENN